MLVKSDKVRSRVDSGGGVDCPQEFFCFHLHIFFQHFVILLLLHLIGNQKQLLPTHRPMMSGWKHACIRLPPVNL